MGISGNQNCDGTNYKNIDKKNNNSVLASYFLLHFCGGRYKLLLLFFLNLKTTQFSPPKNLAYWTKWNYSDEIWKSLNAPFNCRFRCVSFLFAITLVISSFAICESIKARMIFNLRHSRDWLTTGRAIGSHSCSHTDFSSALQILAQLALVYSVDIRSLRRGICCFDFLNILAWLSLNSEKEEKPCLVSMQILHVS